MRGLAKALSVFINLCAYGVGTSVLVIRLAEKNFISVFLVDGFSYSESLFFNMVIFTAGLALTGIVMNMLINEYSKNSPPAEFPIIYEIIPAIIGLVFLYFGFTGATVREKIIVISSALLYILFSSITVYSGAKVFQTYPKEKK